MKIFLSIQYHFPIPKLNSLLNNGRNLVDIFSILTIERRLLYPSRIEKNPCIYHKCKKHPLGLQGDSPSPNIARESNHCSNHTKSNLYYSNSYYLSGSNICFSKKDDRYMSFQK